MSVDGEILGFWTQILERVQRDLFGEGFLGLIGPAPPAEGPRPGPGPRRRLRAPGRAHAAG